MPKLQDEIRKWLDEQGYPLEMRVARTFRKAGFGVLQSEYYQDPSSGNFREIDVVAHLDHEVADEFVRVRFVVECKQTRSKPWLMFCSEDARLAPRGRVVQRVPSKLAFPVLRSLSQREEIQKLDLFSISKPSAYAATQALTSGKDLVFEALCAVGAATAAAATSATASKSYVILFPIVVIEGRLFSCVLKGDASIAVTETSAGTLLWRNPMVKRPHTIVNILTESSLQEFVKTTKTSVRQFFDLAHRDFEEAMASEKRKPDPFRK